MKKNNKKNKLSLTKMNIARLTNSHKIWGGTGDAPDDGTDTQGGDKIQPKQPKCVENSNKIVWE